MLRDNFSARKLTLFRCSASSSLLPPPSTIFKAPHSPVLILNILTDTAPAHLEGTGKDPEALAYNRSHDCPCAFIKGNLLPNPQDNSIIHADTGSDANAWIKKDSLGDLLRISGGLIQSLLGQVEKESPPLEADGSHFIQIRKEKQWVIRQGILVRTRKGKERVTEESRLTNPCLTLLVCFEVIFLQLINCPRPPPDQI